MTGKLLSIGNNSYQNANKLNGAIKDALSIFEVFTNQTQLYDFDSSVCLLDATKEEVINSLLDLTRDSPRLVTVFFAGHGLAYRGSFYCCTEKFHINAPSLAGIEIKEIINIAQDNQVAELNIIIDACQAGASSSSLKEVITSHQADSLMKLCIFCACLENEEAGETPSGGILTSSLINTINGREAGLPINKEYISLFDISNALAPQFEARGQTPVVSGVNLLGQPLVCKNPIHVEGRDNDVVLQASIYQAMNTELSVNAEKSVKKLKQILFNGGNLEYEKLIIEVTKILQDLAPDDLNIEPLLYLLDKSFRESFANEYWSENFYISSSLILSALRFVDQSDNCKEATISMMKDAFNRDYMNLKQNASKWFEDYGLVEHGNAFTECYFLPIRISKLLGRIGTLGLMNLHLSIIPDEDFKKLVEETLETITTTHQLALVLVCESQASQLGLFFDYAARSDLSLTELIYCSYLHDYSETKGKALRSNPSDSNTASYLEARGDNSLARSNKFRLNPDTILTMFLIFSKRLSYEDIIDVCLINFDQRVTNIYNNYAWELVSKLTMEDGVNDTQVLGSDFWTSDQFYDQNRSKLEFDLTLKSCLIALSTHIYENRLHVAKSTNEDDLL